MHLNSLPAKHHLLFLLGYAFGYQELASPAAMLEAPAGCFPQVRILAVPDRMLSQRSDVPAGSPFLQDREVTMPLGSPAGTGR